MCILLCIYVHNISIYQYVAIYIYDIIGLKGLLHKLRLQVTRRISWKRKATCKKNVSGGIWGAVVADWPDQVDVEKKGLGHYSEMERFPVEFPVSQEKLGGSATWGSATFGSKSRSNTIQEFSTDLSANSFGFVLKFDTPQSIGWS